MCIRDSILGVEYCKALLRQHSALVPLALPRRGAAQPAPGEREDVQNETESIAC